MARLFVVSLFILGTLISYRVYRSHKLTAMVQVQEPQSGSLDKNSYSSRFVYESGQKILSAPRVDEKPSLNRAPASISLSTDNCGTDEKCLKKAMHERMVKGALGGDAVGAGALELLKIRSCEKVPACANGGKSFFAMAIARLDPTTMATERLNLQHYLMDSSLGASDKNSLLSNFLQDPVFSKITSTSQQTGDTSFKASQDAMYLMATQLQLIKTGADPETVINSSMAAIMNTQDSLAKSVMTAALIKHYPTQKNAILSALSGH